jgi:hypothetical protein
MDDPSYHERYLTHVGDVLDEAFDAALEELNDGVEERNLEVRQFLDEQ